MTNIINTQRPSGIEYHSQLKLVVRPDWQKVDVVARHLPHPHDWIEIPPIVWEVEWPAKDIVVENYAAKYQVNKHLVHNILYYMGFRRMERSLKSHPDGKCRFAILSCTQNSGLGRLPNTERQNEASASRFDSIYDSLNQMLGKHLFERYSRGLYSSLDCFFLVAKKEQEEAISNMGIQIINGDIIAEIPEMYRER
jgi:hypothetical protein